MCAFTGLFGTRGAHAVDGGLLQRMDNWQCRRSPGQGGLGVEPDPGFGHRRLSIIDMVTRRQPLFDKVLVQRRAPANAHNGVGRS